MFPGDKGAFNVFAVIRIALRPAVPGIIPVIVTAEVQCQRHFRIYVTVCVQDVTFLVMTVANVFGASKIVENN